MIKPVYDALNNIYRQTPDMYYLMMSPIQPELNALIGVIQDQLHHPEGYAFTHTVYVVEAAIEIARRELLSPQDTEVLLLAALCHDLGKATTTIVHPDGRITAYNHPEEGVQPTIAMLQRLNVDNDIINHVIPLVREHMAWVGFYMSEITKRGVRRLARRLLPTNMEMWALIVEADISGRPPKAKGLPARAKEILDITRDMGINEGYKL